MIGLKKKPTEETSDKDSKDRKQNQQQSDKGGQEEGEEQAGSKTQGQSGNGKEDESKGDSKGNSKGNSRGRGRGRGRGVSIFGVQSAKKNDGADGKQGKGRRLKPGEIRVQKDVSELDGGECAQATFSDPNDLMHFKVTISPDDGYWKGFKYTFDFDVPDMYPHEPPKVKCINKIYHPNIDLDGNVCLNILRADWKPVLDINAVIYGLIILFVKPNPNDPLNHEAAETLRKNESRFKDNVQRSLKGLSVNGVEFPPAEKADLR